MRKIEYDKNISVDVAQALRNVILLPDIDTLTNRELVAAILGELTKYTLKGSEV